MNVDLFWKAILFQNEGEIRKYFHNDAVIRWHNTGEEFSLEEFIKVNCAYPGKWEGVVEHVVISDDITVTATAVYSVDDDVRCHVTSFMRIIDGRIKELDEYWGDDADIPEWRQGMNIGRKF